MFYLNSVFQGFSKILKESRNCIGDSMPETKKKLYNCSFYVLILVTYRNVTEGVVTTWAPLQPNAVRNWYNFKWKANHAKSIESFIAKSVSKRVA